VREPIQPQQTNRAVDVTVDTDLDGNFLLKFQGDGFEVNVWARIDDVLRLQAIREADSTERGTIRAGECAGGFAFWGIDGQAVTLLVGSDDEAWDFAVTMPLTAVDEVVRLVVDLSNALSTGEGGDITH
jgi:hypothetical protein